MTMSLMEPLAWLRRHSIQYVNLTSYADALGCRLIWNKNRNCINSGWYRMDLVVDQQTSVFRLRCATCDLVLAPKLVRAKLVTRG
jgi:hypothetical protein